MKTNNAGIQIIKQYESLHDGDLSMVGLQPKRCPAGIWTEGYGRAMKHQGKFLKGKENKELAYKLHTINTEEDAVRALAEDLQGVERQVLSLVTIQLNPNQFSALVSFTYNLGAGALGKSTLLKYLNAGRFQDASNEFVKWNKCEGEVLDGLTKRRLSEKALFLSQVSA